VVNIEGLKTDISEWLPKMGEGLALNTRIESINAKDNKVKVQA